MIQNKYYRMKNKLKNKINVIKYINKNKKSFNQCIKKNKINKKESQKINKENYKQNINKNIILKQIIIVQSLLKDLKDILKYKEFKMFIYLNGIKDNLINTITMN